MPSPHFFPQLPRAAARASRSALQPLPQTPAPAILPHTVPIVHAKYIQNPAKHLPPFRRLIAETRPMTSSLSVAIPLLFLASCSPSTPPVTHAAPPHTSPDTPRAKREVRVSGIVEAVRSSKILVPQIWSQGGPMPPPNPTPNAPKVNQPPPNRKSGSTASSKPAPPSKILAPKTGVRAAP